MKKLLVWVLALVMSFTLVGCGSDDSSSTIDKIKAAGVLKVGVKDDRINFGLQNTDTKEYEGYEIDIAKAIAKEILGDENAIEFTPVTAATRAGLLDGGEIDCIVATFTITDERRESWNFSTPYYTDAVGVMTKKGVYEGLKDMDGATVAVAVSTTSKDSIIAAADDLGVTLNFKEFAGAPECVAALNSGVVDGYTIDVTSLLSYLNDSLEILPDRFSPQDFGVATRLDDKEMTDLVESVITKLTDDGTLAKWQAAWGIDS